MSLDENDGCLAGWKIRQAKWNDRDGTGYKIIVELENRAECMKKCMEIDDMKGIFFILFYSYKFSRLFIFLQFRAEKLNAQN